MFLKAQAQAQVFRENALQSGASISQFSMGSLPEYVNKWHNKVENKLFWKQWTDFLNRAT